MIFIYFKQWHWAQLRTGQCSVASIFLVAWTYVVFFFKTRLLRIILIGRTLELHVWYYMYNVPGHKDSHFNLKAKEWLKALSCTVLDYAWLQEINKRQISQQIHNMLNFHIPGSVSQTLEKIRVQMVKMKNKPIKYAFKFWVMQPKRKINSSTTF